MENLPLPHLHINKLIARINSLEVNNVYLTNQITILNSTIVTLGNSNLALAAVASLSTSLSQTNTNAIVLSNSITQTNSNVAQTNSNVVSLSSSLSSLSNQTNNLIKRNPENSSEILLNGTLAIGYTWN